MKRFLLALSLLLTLGLGAQAVAAQTDASTPAAGMSFDDIDGLESAYSRSYSVDYMALMATPDFDMSDTSALLKSVSVQFLVFESDDAANDFLNLARDMVNESEASMVEIGETEISETTIGDTDAVQVTVSVSDPAMGMTVQYFADGNTVFMITGIDSDVEGSTALATGVGEYILATDASDAEITLNEDGTSTGGGFDRLPAAGDEIVGDLTSVFDMDLTEVPAE